MEQEGQELQKPSAGEMHGPCTVEYLAHASAVCCVNPGAAGWRQWHWAGRPGGVALRGHEEPRCGPRQHKHRMLLYFLVSLTCPGWWTFMCLGAFSLVVVHTCHTRHSHHTCPCSPTRRVRDPGRYGADDGSPRDGVHHPRPGRDAPQGVAPFESWAQGLRAQV